MLFVLLRSVLRDFFVPAEAFIVQQRNSLFSSRFLFGDALPEW
jgi:hypothetical protein